MMDDPWCAFDDASELPDPERAARLQEIHSQLQATGLSGTAEVVELEAVIAAELSRLGSLPLAVAVEATDSASRVGKHGWPNYYLAQAALRHESYDLVLSSVARIPRGYFESRHILWRQVHCFEMETIAHFALGDYKIAEQAAERLLNALAARGDSDDLAPPVDLVTYSLGSCSKQGNLQIYHLLQLVVMSIDVDEWFSAQTAGEIRRCLAAA